MTRAAPLAVVTALGAGMAPFVGVYTIVLCVVGSRQARTMRRSFALAPENARLSGCDPMDPDVVERHADYVARLFVP